MEKEGLIKFSYNQIASNLICVQNLGEWNQVRDACISNQWIGIDAKNISFGNMSQRSKRNSFFITSSQSGNIRKLAKTDITLVKKVDLLNHNLEFEGPKLPSSESISHYAMYKGNPEFKNVIHIHSKSLFEKFYDLLPSVPIEIGYGTKEMADYVLYLSKIHLMEGNNSSLTIIMKGHEDGLICASTSFMDCLNSLTSLKIQV